MKDNISFSKLVAFLKKVMDEEDIIITEIVLNNEQMDLVVKDHLDLMKYYSSYRPFKKFTNENELSFQWKYGKIKLKRTKNE